MKKTISSFKIIEFFFCDLINELSVLKFHNSLPSLVDMALITLSKSIVKNLTQISLNYFLLKMKMLFFSMEKVQSSS